MINNEDWSVPQTVLVFLAHPDDPEFFLGATIARWVNLGHEVHYCLLTRGDKGSNDPQVNPEDLGARREVEQSRAAVLLGVKSVRYLNYRDGYLISDLETRRSAARVIRQVRPDILVTSDPTNYFLDGIRINHPDHRTAGQIVTEGLFPAAGNFHYFPDLFAEGLQPHTPNEVWYALTRHPNTTLDVTTTWELKIQAILQHTSQVANPEALVKRFRDRRNSDSSQDAPKYEEKFLRIIMPK